jgi:hypothetical protein
MNVVEMTGSGCGAASSRALAFIQPKDRKQRIRALRIETLSQKSSVWIFYFDFILMRRARNARFLRFVNNFAQSVRTPAGEAGVAPEKASPDEEFRIFLRARMERGR